MSTMYKAVSQCRSLPILAPWGKAHCAILAKCEFALPHGAKTVSKKNRDYGTVLFSPHGAEIHICEFCEMRFWHVLLCPMGRNPFLQKSHFF